ncbi:unnamed protein product [Bursaphelenchus xylophilus]|uniref:(pine wood nematode) hypothetical protein n=1 Tax=Bursaphelenchus xylophilus TaxID=6326 RepID=A0A7I8XFE1_BURXY|nr:unnamed protein product [Bursaphelenchus xylophilus]CAG9124310.1 unnamed protein product [Bursaphelenchus xylophilus]
MSSDINWTPAVTAVTFYAFVIVTAEGSQPYLFFMELIAVTQQCTCVYENAIMIKNYGPIGFFSAVFTILVVTAQYNRGAYISPLLPVEMAWKEAMDSVTLLTLLAAQTLGGYSASRIADSLWYYTSGYSAEHAQLYSNLPCALKYHVPFIFALGYEFLGCFVLRLVLSNLSLKYRRYIMPFVTSAALTFALVYVGVPGLNPVTTSSRLMGCPGLDLQWFMITYWTAPVLGWMAASYIDRKKLFKVPKKGNPVPEQPKVNKKKKNK